MEEKSAEENVLGLSTLEYAIVIIFFQTEKGQQLFTISNTGLKSWLGSGTYDGACIQKMKNLQCCGGDYSVPLHPKSSEKGFNQSECRGRESVTD
jgi:hypothetical protein